MAEALEQQCVRVGGVEIPAHEIALEAQNHPARDAEEAWKEAAKALAVRQLLLAEADRQGIAAEDTVDPEGRRLVDDDARIDALLAANVKIPSARREEAERYYARHRDQFTSETLIEAEHILFSASPNDVLAYEMAAGDARALIRELRVRPERFADLAREKSACPSSQQGGNLGQIGRGQTVKEFEDALFCLGEGELHPEPVRSPFGVHVLRAGRRFDGCQLPFKTVEASIRDYLEEASYRRAVAQYLSILAGETEIVGVDLPLADGPLVQ